MELYNKEKKSMSKIECNNHCNQQLKFEFPWIKQEDAASLPQNDNVYVFDLGLKEFLTDNNGSHIKDPEALYKYERKLAKKQRQIAKKEKGSRNWNKKRIEIARLH
jgi:transposase